jgi:hypothetical protein
MTPFAVDVLCKNLTTEDTENHGGHRGKTIDISLMRSEMKQVYAHQLESVISVQ